MVVAAAGRNAVERLPASGRLRDMHRRLELRLRHAGVAEDDSLRVLDAAGTALMHRLHVLRDEAHPDLLHPARTVLILLDDCDVAEPDLLEAGAYVESEFPELRVPHRSDVARAVPTVESGDMLLEDLVAATVGVRLVSLAERLDHARHLHLHEPERWTAFHRQTRDVYRPVALRTHAVLARRYDTWCRMFERRFLDAPPSE